ncbi:MAG: hypothetical protein JXM69_13740 [Anaerolineae bacterium]|nr:hypothetical protein [Anaerolineae bacterium]
MLSQVNQTEIEQKQKLLEQHRRNLGYLEQQAVQYGLEVPLAMHNALVAEQDAIVSLEQELAMLGTSPRLQPKWQALVIDTDSHWQQIILNNISQLGGKGIVQPTMPKPEQEAIDASSIAIVGVPGHPPEDRLTRQWIEDVVKLGCRLPLVLLADGKNRDTAIALRRTIGQRPEDITAVTIFKENFDPNWFSRVVHEILIH